MIYVYVRQSTDWSDDAVAWSQLPPGFREKVEAWNATFSMPYFTFRHRIKQIAQRNLAAIEGASCVEDWDDIPDSSLVVPVDDDDWFSPQAGRVLERALAPGICGYYWTSRFIEIPIHYGHQLGLLRKKLFANTPAKWICTTNNYALLKTPESRELCQLHTRASGWFTDHPERVHKLERELSAMNRTLASQTSLNFMKPTVSPAYLARKYEKYRKLYGRPVPAGLAWTETYVRMMAELMDELALRPR